MIKPYVTAEEAAELLNSAFNIDPEAMAKLLLYRVPCNLTLANHPTIQVVAHPENGPKNPEVPEGAEFGVGLLGILNGIFGFDPENGLGAIRVELDEGKIVRFRAGRA